MAAINGDQEIRSDLNPVVVSALKGCGTRELIIDTFDKYTVTPLRDRIDYLNAAMGNPQTFFSANNITDEMRYDVTIAMFIDGTWQLNALYEKAGL